MANESENIEPNAIESTERKHPQEYNAIYTLVDMKAKPNTLAHWAVHIVMAIIIAIFCFMTFTATGKIIQRYGWSEGIDITSTYQDHEWEQVGLNLEYYAYYYDMYYQHYDSYADQYQAMDISSMKELMDSMYESMADYIASNGQVQTLE